MSIVIKGMDMPTSCSRCPCSNDASRFCRVVEEYIPMLGKPAFCPLVDVPDTNVGDMINRQAAIDDIKAMYEWHDVVTEDRLIEHMKRLPSAQPERKKDEWCTDCKEYDSEKHCCHRFGKVIRKTVEELKAYQQWIPVKQNPERSGWYIVTKRFGNGETWIGTKWYSTAYGWNGDGILAWMELPEAYKEDE